MEKPLSESWYNPAETKMGKRIKNITSGSKPNMTPQEFVKTWNILLATTKKGVKSDEQLPQVILSLDMMDGLRNKLDFVIGRMNIDKDVQQEVSKALGVGVVLQTVSYKDSIQIIANNR